MTKADSITGGTLSSIDIYECPHCHEKFEMKWGSFINHIRWCKKNPNKNDIKEQTRKNVSFYQSIEI